MVANTTPTLTVKLPDEGIDVLYRNDPDTFIAGSVHPPMNTIQARGGYSISGRNPLFSNVHEAQWVLVLALVMKQDKMKMHNVHPEMIGALLKASDCEIIDTWYTAVGW